MEEGLLRPLTRGWRPKTGRKQLEKSPGRPRFEEQEGRQQTCATELASRPKATLMRAGKLLACDALSFQDQIKAVRSPGTVRAFLLCCEMRVPNEETVSQITSSNYRASKII